jgi:hypothetical protein
VQDVQALRAVDTISAIAMFAIPWDRLENLPPRCCACGKPAVRMEPMVSKAFRGVELSAQLPHCETCQRGATIQQGTQVTGDAATANPQTFLSIAVKSHRFYNDVMMLNDGEYAKRSLR